MHLDVFYDVSLQNELLDGKSFCMFCIFCIFLVFCKRFKDKLKYKIPKIIISFTMANLKQNKTNTDNVNDIDPENYVEEPWNIINSYFHGKHLKQLVRHQLESYNDFVSFQIQKTICMFNPVHICSEQDYDKTVNKHKLEMYITFENFSIHRQQINTKI